VQVKKDIPYCQVDRYDPLLNTLDIYHGPLGPRQPKRTIVIFIHGGGWSGGDKARFPEPLERSMPAWFVQRGYVFVAINFRLAGNRRSPAARVSDMAYDVGKALKWLSVNGRRFGGRTSGFVLLGYSSGAHIAALVATHKCFLEAHRLTTAHLRGVIALDVAHFDVPLTMRALETEDTGLPDQALRQIRLYQLFGAQRADQDKLSPVVGLGPWLNRTAFLMVSAGLQLGRPQTLSRRMSEHFKERLSTHGIRSDHYHLDNWEHADLVNRWGGELAARVGQFLDEIDLNHSTGHESQGVG
jgi:acetyl esterase/lipase